MRRIVAASLAAALGVGVASAQPLDVPVMVGGEAYLDACAAVGQIARLDPNGDGFLAVRKGPATRHAKIDELYNGDIVILCDEAGGWYGIVYGMGDCGTSSPIAQRTMYRGPCRVGWVYGRYVDEIAG